MNSKWWSMGIIGAAMVVGYASYVITGVAEGPVETAAEAVLKSHGIDIDLSPNEG